MKPFFADNLVTQYNGDARQMAELPDNSVQCVVTSPPYWGLRKYSGLPNLIWGDNHCEHQWGEAAPAGYRSSDTNPGKLQSIATQNRDGLTSSTCSLCGAWKGQYGLEPTPEMYIEHTLEFLREIKRVLRPDGVVFWNLGDSYYSSPSNQQGKGNPSSGVGVRGCQEVGRITLPRHNILKPKDLCLIPFRVAIAAQEDGWWVRSVIIWSKPNPMPESVTDRPTESHEYILMLTKSAKYYWDQEAVREPQQMSSLLRATRGWEGDTQRGYPNGPQNHIDKYFNKPLEEALSLPGRNIRSVWEFPTQPYPAAHFAVFPEKLPETCIKAATPEAGCCSKCGAPWERIVEKTKIPEGTTHTRYGKQDNGGRLALHRQGVREEGHEEYIPPKTLGWKPTCKCGEYTCNTCGIVLEYSEGRSNTNDTYNYKEQSLQTMQERIPGDRQSAEREELLLGEVQTDLDSPKQKVNKGFYNQSEGLQNDICARTPDVIKGGLCDGTSVGNGGTPGENANTGGGCASQERTKDGQQDREFGIDDKQKTQQRMPKGKEALDNLPKLSASVFSKRECPVCKGALGFTPSEKSPSLVLDCFSGSGTTLWVAKKLGRRAVGYELSEEYCQLALERNRQMGMELQV